MPKELILRESVFISNTKKSGSENTVPSV